MKLLLVLLCFVAVILSGCEARPKAHRRDRILSRSHIHARKAPTCGYEVRFYGIGEFIGILMGIVLRENPEEFV